MPYTTLCPKCKAGCHCPKWSQKCTCCEAPCDSQQSCSRYENCKCCKPADSNCGC